MLIKSYNLKSITEFIRENKLFAKKALGQNFLIEQNILDIIIETGEIKAHETILEIGPGLGALTTKLKEKSKNIKCIEIDKSLYKILIENFKTDKNITFINQDALKYEIKEKNYKVIANIPYYISSPLIDKFLTAENKAKSIILLVQKELADKINEAGTKNILSLKIKLIADFKYIKTVSEKCFYPSPKVKSAIIKISPHKNSEINNKDYKEIIKIAKIAFSSKRKKMINNLKKHIKFKNYNLKNIFDNINLDQNIRAEALSLKNWKDLNKALLQESKILKNTDNHKEYSATQANYD